MSLFVVYDKDSFDDNLYAMLHQITFHKSEILDSVESYPTVSIVLPFEPKMSVHRELEHQLTRVCNRVDKYLAKNYPPATFGPVMDKLWGLVRNIDFTSFKKSVAFFVSPVCNKIIYLDIPVTERIIIDEPFCMRDLVHSKKDEQEYLVLKVNGESSKIFFGSKGELTCIVATMRPTVKQDEISLSACIPSGRPQYIVSKPKTLYSHVDNVLNLVHDAYDLPVFVVGTKEHVRDFKTVTRYGNYVNDYIITNDAGNSARLLQLLEPYVGEWRQVKTKFLMQQLNRARRCNNLSAGIHDTWRQAHRKHEYLLLIEENYTFPQEELHHNEADDDTVTTTFFIRDKVDEIIEKVLENGGDVEFVDDGILRDYNHIALM